MTAEEKLKRIQELRDELLRLGQTIIIPGRELPQPDNASDADPQDIKVYPVFA